ADHDIAFNPVRNEREQPEVPKQIPIRSRIGRQYAGIRRLIQYRRSNKKRGQSDGDDQKRKENNIAPPEGRPKWLPTLFKQVLIFSAISRRIDWFAGNGWLRNTMAKHKPEMQADKAKHYSRQNENMDGEESTKRRAANGITSKDESRHPVADN